MEGWVDLGYPAMHRPGTELATYGSLVRRPTTTLTEQPKCAIQIDVYFTLLQCNFSQQTGIFSVRCQPMEWTDIWRHCRSSSLSHSDVRTVVPASDTYWCGPRNNFAIYAAQMQWWENPKSKSPNLKSLDFKSQISNIQIKSNHKSFPPPPILSLYSSPPAANNSDEN